MIWVGRDLKLHFVPPPAMGHVAPSPHGLEHFEGCCIPGIPKIDPKYNLNIDTTLIFQVALGIATNPAWF